MPRSSRLEDKYNNNNSGLNATNYQQAIDELAKGSVDNLQTYNNSFGYTQFIIKDGSYEFWYVPQSTTITLSSTQTAEVYNDSGVASTINSDGVFVSRPYNCIYLVSRSGTTDTWIPVNNATLQVGANSNGLKTTGLVLELEEATTSSSGAMSATDKTNLDATTANSHSPVTLGVNRNGLNLNNQVLQLLPATSTVNGAFTFTEKNKLATVDFGAEANEVDSVNGETGAVSLNTDDINEGSNNLYYTDARVSANNTVSALQTASHNAVTIGTANGLSMDANQELDLALATSSTNGALSSTDYNSFDRTSVALTIAANTTLTALDITNERVSGGIILPSIEITATPTQTIFIWDNYIGTFRSLGAGNSYTQSPNRSDIYRFSRVGNAYYFVRITNGDRFFKAEVNPVNNFNYNNTTGSIVPFNNVRKSSELFTHSVNGTITAQRNMRIRAYVAIRTLSTSNGSGSRISLECEIRLNNTKVGNARQSYIRQTNGAFVWNFDFYEDFEVSVNDLITVIIIRGTGSHTSPVVLRDVPSLTIEALEF